MTQSKPNQRPKILPKILTVFGTRPEAIKLAPFVLAANASDAVDHRFCVTGQHRQMLDQVMAMFGLSPDYDLNIMKAGQTLDDVVCGVLQGAGAIMDEWRPDWVVVQGDTSTAFAAALAGFHRKVRVAHVEAGLRTGNLLSPWPEEANRRLIGQVSSLHFAPTGWAQANLLREGFDPKIVEVTGNTVIDALHWVTANLDAAAPNDPFPYLNSDKRLILVTGHRRENLDGGLERSCTALAALSARDDVEIVYPVHLNPLVREVADRVLGNRSNVHLIPPQDYLPFVQLMRRAAIIVTDSGGIQEEAPGLGKPVLVTRDTTERPEAIEAGTAMLVGTEIQPLVDAVTRLLDDPQAYATMAQARNPFGDGQASARMLSRIIMES